MPLNQLQVGPQTVPDSSSNFPTARAGRDGAAVAQQLHGKYYELSLRGNVFISTTVIAGLATPVAAATLPATGIILINPLGSGRIVELISFTHGSSSSAYIVNCLGLMIQRNLSTTSLVPTAGIVLNYICPLGVQNATPKAAVWTGATCTNVAIPGVSAATAVPIAFYPMFSFGATGITDIKDLTHNFDGKVLLEPDTLVATCNTKAAETNLKFLSIIWAEWPI